MRVPSTYSQDWAMELFGDAELGDARRTKRLVHSAACIHEHPAGSLPHKFHDPAALEGFYRLANEADVNHAEIIRCAAQKTWQRMRAENGVVLLVEDTTVADYSGLDIDGLGQVGDGNGRGLYIHNLLATTPERHVLGLAGQLLHRRRKVPKNETKPQRQKAPDRESLLWKKACMQLPVAPAGHRWVDVADRGADITEFLAYEHQADRLYLVRSQHNRKVIVEHVDGTILETKLHDYVRSQASMTSQSRQHEVQATGKRSARVAELALSWVKLKIVPPRQARGEHDDTPLPVYVVRVWEVNPPPSEKGVEWILLTNVAVEDESSAWERVDWYCVRWMTEEYHKGLKTGVEIEKLQFTTRAALDVTIAVLSVVAVALLDMRDAARNPQRASEPATKYVPQLWVSVLSKWRHGKVYEEWTYRDFVMALARLGGHQNRKGDHPPGWLILWRGWSQLQMMLLGAITVAIE